MPNENEIKVWKTFLEGRVQQEKGNDEYALKAFDEALRARPDNQHFINSKAIALQRLDRGGEDKVALVQQWYEQLATTLVGENDKPEDWIAGLTAILSDLEGAAPREGAVRPLVAGVAW
jgi:Flp pilus assembly protein TadD